MGVPSPGTDTDCIEGERERYITQVSDDDRKEL